MNENPPKAFAAIEIGDDIGPVTQTVTSEIVQHYADVVRIDDRRFIDPGVAREKGFTQPIVREHLGDKARVKTPSSALP